MYDNNYKYIVDVQICNFNYYNTKSTLNDTKSINIENIIDFNNYVDLLLNDLNNIKKIFIEEIYYDYDLLIKNVYSQIENCFQNKILKFNLTYKLNYFEKRKWFLIIKITTNNKNNENNKNIKDNENNENNEENKNIEENEENDDDSYISINDSIFDDKFEWDLKEWIIRLIYEKKELELYNKKLINENIELKNLLNKNKKI